MPAYSRPKIYLASPLGFAESTRSYMRFLEKRIRELGFRVLNPWTLKANLEAAQEIERAQEVRDRKRRLRMLRDANERIAAANEAAIHDCDLLLAVLDGPDVDSGTAAEIGFAAALGRRLLGLRTDFRSTGDNEGAVVNLQVQWWIERTGIIARSFEELEEALHDVLKSTPST